MRRATRISAFEKRHPCLCPGAPPVEVRAPELRIKVRLASGHQRTLYADDLRPGQPDLLSIERCAALIVQGLVITTDEQADIVIELTPWLRLFVLPGNGCLPWSLQRAAELREQLSQAIARVLVTFVGLTALAPWQALSVSI